jgi:hypothetical protein
MDDDITMLVLGEKLAIFRDKLGGRAYLPRPAGRRPALTSSYSLRDRNINDGLKSERRQEP